MFGVPVPRQPPGHSPHSRLNVVLTNENPPHTVQLVRRETAPAAVESRASVPTIGGGEDTTIPSPGRSPKQPLPGIGLHDPLHGRQACPEFNSVHQGLVK